MSSSLPARRDAKKFPLGRLPSELLTSIFHHLPTADRCSIDRVCSRFARLIGNLGYINAECEEIQIDFENQVLVVRWERHNLLVCLNANLEQNKTFHWKPPVETTSLNRHLRKERSKLFDLFFDWMKYEIRDVGDNWNQLIERYLAKMKMDFRRKTVGILRIDLPHKKSYAIPSQLLKLHDVKIRELNIHRFGRRSKHVSMPLELVPLMNKSETCNVPYYLNIDILSQLKSRKIVGYLRDDDAVEMIRSFARGSLPITADAWNFKVYGEGGMFLVEGLLHVDPNSFATASIYTLPTVRQSHGQDYAMRIQADGRISVFERDYCSFFY